MSAQGQVGQFDELIAIRHFADGARAEVDSSVSGFGGAHGGYVAALALEAMGERVEPDRPPRALTAHLLASVGTGPLALDAAVERSGGTVTAASVRATQSDRLALTALALFGAVGGGVERLDLRMPDVPPPEECEPLFDKAAPLATALMLVEHRPAAPPLPLTGGEEAQLVVWMRLTEDRPLDAASLTFLADSAPPALFGVLTEFVPMPSVEIAIHFEPEALRPADRWVLCITRGHVAASGYASEEAELWAVDGRLLATSRQRRRVLV